MTNTVPIEPIRSVKFMGSFPSYQKAPESNLREFAFIGRSNVGKSSLINFLCDRKKLAKTSGTPGKTQLINLFEINEDWILADLPGYGYARVSKRTRSKWETMIKDYLMNRPNLFLVFQLIDIRIPPQEIDLQQINWMGENQIPFVIIFTKADRKHSRQEKKQIKSFMEMLSETWEYPPEFLVTSTQDKRGREELLRFMHE
jgi:GTP-binding protein